MNRTVITAGMLLLVSTAAAAAVRAADEERDIVGKYECKGADADGTEYAGTVEIKKRKDAYVLAWSLGRFGIFQGMGIRSGNTLSVSWVSGGTAGVMAYQIEKDGTLNGRWALFGGNGSIQKETLTPKK